MPTQSDNNLTRIQSEKVWDDKPIQRLEALGRHGERLGGTGGEFATPRVQNYGFTNHPPKGSIGVTNTLGGNPTNAMITNMEHPDFRPKNLEEGEFKLYEKWGGYDHARQDRWIRKVGNATIECIRSGNIVHLNRSGAS